MAFTARTFVEILTDMLNYVRDNSGLTDFEVGSAIRTILEAAALEDDEQYFQMVQLLDGFAVRNATGILLEKRVADAGLERLQPASSVGTIIIEDGTLPTSTLLFDTGVGSLSLQLLDSSPFATVGIYTVRIGEGTTSVEDVVITANNVVINTLTCAPTLNAHNAGDRVSFVSGVADLAIAPNQQVQQPGVDIVAAIVLVTTETGTIVNGNFESTPIAAKATIPGTSGNVGVGAITQFVSAPPFNGALVTNKVKFGGGREVETDAELQDRYFAHLQSLSAGTALALQQASLGIFDTITGQRVVTASVVSDQIDDETVVYVDDGTGFTPDKVTLATSTLTIAKLIGDTTLQVDSAAAFPGEGYIIVSPNSITDIEVIQYTAVNYTTNILTLALPGLINNHPGVGDEVSVVDAITLDAESGATYFKTAKFPILRNSARLWIDNGGGFSLQTLLTDYRLNRGRGEIQLTSGLALGGKLVLHYSYYTGLIFDVQKVLNGDSNDPTNFPGVACDGELVVVETPVIRRISVKLSITARPGFNEDDLRPLVQQAVENYISGLGIGKDVILASIIQASMNVPGMFDVIPVLPTGDLVILEDELPVPFDASGNTLIEVL
jgi:uncharacterized phage protein gp47/JayE